MQEWQIWQIHQEFIDSFGPDQGITKAKDGFITKYDGKKVK